MEPADLNSPPDDRRLAGLLQQTSVPIADDGFSDRVLAALPAPPSAAPRLIPFVATATGGVIGVAYARWQGATTGELETAGRALAALARQGAPLLDSPWVWLTGAVILASCYSALRLAGLARVPFRR
jgi:hypothetical protein